PLVVPLEPAAKVDPLPYLPDPLARAATFRNLPGTPAKSATRIEFGGRDDWQNVKPFRLALEHGDGPPQWNPADTLLTVALPKGRTQVVAMSSCCDAEDLKVMGVWGWLREQIEYLTKNQIEDDFYRQVQLKDRIAHV